MGARSGPQTLKEQIQAFQSAITWSEPFILCLLAFDLFIILLSIIAIQKRYGRIVIICIIYGIIYSSQYLNTYGAIHWESFATQNYFDKNGIFLSIMLCAPLLFISLCTLISLVREASQLVVKVKVKEMEAKKLKSKSSSNKNNKSEKKKTSTTANNTSTTGTTKKENKKT